MDQVNSSLEFLLTFFLGVGKTEVSTQGFAFAKQALCHLSSTPPIPLLAAEKSQHYFSKV
jgi:hypothetical protein